MPLELRPLKLEKPPYDFGAAFRTMAQGGAQMVLVLSSPFFVERRPEVAALAIEHRLPTMFVFRCYVESGGLMSYGVEQLAMYRRIGLYVAKILKGTKPADLPVEQPTKFELVVNLKTAKAIGIELPHLDPAPRRRGDRVRRRKFITLLGGAAAAWPRAARAQTKRARIGWFTVAPHPYIEGFRRGLKELGWIEGENVVIVHTYADGHPGAVAGAGLGTGAHAVRSGFGF